MLALELRCYSWRVLCLSKGLCIGLRGVFAYGRGPCLVSEGLVFSSRWSFFKPKMGFLKPGMGPFGPRMGPFRPVMGPFRPGMGPLRLTKSFFSFYFFSFLVKRALLKK